jgi:hypothetical protein
VPDPKHRVSRPILQGGETFLAIEHDTSIPWPNGEGETPCSSLYAQTVDELSEAEDKAREAEDIEDWAAYNVHAHEVQRLRMALHDLQEGGHLGQPVVFDKPCPATALLAGAEVDLQGRVFNGDRYVGRL